MTITKVNVLDVELDDLLDEAGFRHVATEIGPRLGARRIGASVYLATAGVPIWPYHYHHGIEEWLYVVEGAPVLREPAGDRSLRPGDLVAFPSGPAGAHTLKGPGRLVIFATGQQVEPYLSVYPDSDKVGGPEGILLRSSAVGYWHGEGTAGRRDADEIGPGLEASASRRAVNALTFTGSAAELLGADRLAGTVVDLGQGAASADYHCVYGREQWLLVLAGSPTLRHSRGEDDLVAGDLVCLREGAAGAHQLRNRHEAVARALVLSTTGFPANIHYPDTGYWLIRNTPDREATLREFDATTGENAGLRTARP